MLFGQSRDEGRQSFFDVWQKFKNKEALTDLEKQILAVMMEHPEYHKIFDAPEQFLQKEFMPEVGETNPFMHLGLHLTLRDQITTNRPEGISDIFQSLLEKHGDRLYVEHQMMECLIESIWKMFQTQNPQDTEAYLDCLKAI